MKNLYLVGYRGTGKTTLGKSIVNLLERQGIAVKLVDTDRLIVEREGRTIPEIFAVSGEKYFREVERALIRELAASENSVVACGGGVVIDDANIADLKNNGIVALLVAEVEDIFSRIENDANRPALSACDGQDEIVMLLKARRLQYEKAADFTVNTSIHTEQEATDLIAQTYLKFVGKGEKQ